MVIFLLLTITPSKTAGFLKKTFLNTYLVDNKKIPNVTAKFPIHV